jgi:hypothetical protein
LLSTTAIGKGSSTVAGATGGATAKNAKATDADQSVIGHWVQTNIGNKELMSVEKIGLLKNNPAEVLIAIPKIIPRPSAGFWVIFLAFLLQGLSLPLILFFEVFSLLTGFSSMI